MKITKNYVEEATPSKKIYFAVARKIHPSNQRKKEKLNKKKT